MTFDGMLDRLIAAYGHMGRSAVGGEWGEINGKDRVPFLDALAAGDRARLSGILRAWLVSPLGYGMLTVATKGVKPEHMLEADMTEWALQTDANPHAIEVLRAPVVAVAASTQLTIMPDTPRHDHHAQRIIRFAAGDVAEIGGGYGGVIIQLRRRAFPYRIYDVDIPETLYLAFAVLALQPETEDVAFLHEGRHAAITLVPAADKGAVPRPLGMVYSMNALGEMDHGTAAGYMAWIADMAPRWFYHHGVHHGRDFGTMSLEYDEVAATALRPVGYAELYRMHSHWWGNGGRYWEFLLERT
jgi:hypothetical protein